MYNVIILGDTRGRLSNMSASHRFYNMKSKILSSVSFEDDDLFIKEDEEDEFDEDVEGGYMQEVPYTSSSVDRSSVSSIPWADDAIKLNQLEWEKIEKMLGGLEPLPAEEDLSHELIDWQQKFPILLKSSQNYKMKTFSSDTLNIDSLETLNISSDDEEAYNLDRNRNVATAERTNLGKQYSTEEISTTPTPTQRKFSEESSNLSQLLTTHSLKLIQREPNNKKSYAANEKSATSTDSYSSPYSLNNAKQTPSPPTPPVRQRFKMPPILNVLESSRKFKSLAMNGGPNKNTSFVQLTQVQKPLQPQIKSALISHDHITKSDRFPAGRHRSAWQLPLAANRFFNSRNSIILPAITSRRQLGTNQYAHMRPQNSVSTESSSSVSDSTGNARQAPQTMRSNLLGSNYNAYEQGRAANLLSSSSSQMISSSTGRSISAAMQHPRTTGTTNFSAFYLPYSASKFKAFK